MKALRVAVDRMLKAWDWHLANPTAPIAGIAALDARVEELRSIARRFTDPDRKSRGGRKRTPAKVRAAPSDPT